jgi:hypothetical protein
LWVCSIACEHVRVRHCVGEERVTNTAGPQSVQTHQMNDRVWP